MTAHIGSLSFPCIQVAKTRHLSLGCAASMQTFPRTYLAAKERCRKSDLGYNVPGNEGSGLNLISVWMEDQLEERTMSPMAAIQDVNMMMKWLKRRKKQG